MFGAIRRNISFCLLLGFLSLTFLLLACGEFSGKVRVLYSCELAALAKCRCYQLVKRDQSGWCFWDCHSLHRVLLRGLRTYDPGGELLHVAFGLYSQEERVGILFKSTTYYLTNIITLHCPSHYPRVFVFQPFHIRLSYNCCCYDLIHVVEPITDETPDTNDYAPR